MIVQLAILIYVQENSESLTPVNKPKIVQLWGWLNKQELLYQFFYVIKMTLLIKRNCFWTILMNILL